MKEFNYTYDDLFNPVLSSLNNLGGSASIQEMEDEVSRIMSLSEDEINDIHRGSITKLSYRLAWARNYLKRFGLVENSSRAVWSLTPEGLKQKSVDQVELKRAVKAIKVDKRSEVNTGRDESEEDIVEELELDWQNGCLDILLQLEPGVFERLCQRILRELGFVNLEVTGRSGDGGIDGKGVLKFGEVLSFTMMFQCKRYKGSVSPSYIRDFRGAMIGRADKGLFITTGSFTREAKREAQREGAPPIDLVDGIQLMDIMKKLELGISTEMVERVEVKKDWFQNI
ncbi:restriction endonuclease [Chloroflexota bacterium]